MIFRSNMKEKCNEGRCAHYLNVETFHYYRHKFIWIISIAAFLSSISLIVLTYNFYKGQEVIVENNKIAIGQVHSMFKTNSKAKDGLHANDYLSYRVEVHMNEIKSLLELQSANIKSEFSILSLWAGVLMIVFLVFSIYSMFKTDELLKQSREGLKAIESAEEKAASIIDKVETKTDEELNKVSQKANEESMKIYENAQQTIEEVKKDIDSMRESFAIDVARQSEASKTLFDELMNKMKETEVSNAKLFNGFIQQMKDISSGESSK